MAIEVFSRYELKFMLDRDQFAAIHSEIQRRMEPDKYSRDGSFYTISNIYYDTPDDHLISTAVRHEGKYRYKLRLRTYDPSQDMAFLEIKKKYRGLTNKRRTTILIEDGRRLMEQGIAPEERHFMNKQVTRELLEIANEMTLRPKTLISYDRRAYFGGDEFEPDLRITFDSAIRSRRTDLELRHGSYGTLLLDGEYYIMEVKVSNSVPLWIARLLSENGVSRTHFSKYGAEYKQHLAENFTKTPNRERTPDSGKITCDT